MESRIQRFVLAATLIVGAMTVGIPTLHAEEEEERSILDDVVSPDLKRREIQEDKIDSENIEIGIYGGIMSFEDFGSNDVYGVRLDLHITEDIFVEANLGLSTLQKTSAERLSPIPILTDDERELMYYNLGIGLNLFPGQLYFANYAYNSSFYVLGGAGNTEFGGNEYLTYHFGAGFRLYVTDWMALRIDLRNHVLSHDIFLFEKKIQNLEGIVGLTLFL